MPKLYIHAINSEFRSRDNGAEFIRLEDTLPEAIRSAAALAVDEIHKGKASTAIEVRIEQADGTPLLRSVLSMSVSALLPTARTAAASPQIKGERERMLFDQAYGAAEKRFPKTCSRLLFPETAH